MLCVSFWAESRDQWNRHAERSANGERAGYRYPAHLLANRPDVQQAEYNLINAFENTNIARTCFYPALTLKATGGLSKTSLSTFFSSSSLFGNIVAGLAHPIFKKGANKAQPRIRQA